MVNCDNKKKVVAFFSSKINPKNIFPDFMRKNRSVNLYRDPLECFGLSISFSKPVFTRMAFLKYIQKQHMECFNISAHTS